MAGEASRDPGAGQGKALGQRPRREETPGHMPGSPPCTFCGGEDTEILSSFGSHASVSTYWCRGCRSPFELLKWR
jgi:hypothetical protein